MHSSILLGLSIVALVHAQTFTLSSCVTQGSVVNCLRQGTTVPWTTYQSATTTAAVATSTNDLASLVPTAISECHMHSSSTQFCFAGTSEYEVLTEATATEELPSQYTGCHSHGSSLFCLSPGGEEVAVKAQTTEGEATEGEATEGEAEVSSEEISCHSHAGVEHCVDANGNTVEQSCDAVNRNYNVALRIGLVFVILATSAIGVFAPIFLASATRLKSRRYVLSILKQFGTGVIISTSLVHLFTHAELMFASECLGGLEYEATTAAIAMAGIMLSFLPEYIGSRIFIWRVGKHRDISVTTPVTNSKEGDLNHNSTNMSSSDCIEEQSTGLQTMKVNIMEAGIIFHSLLIGLTLVVAGDSFFKTLFVVVLFHQMFEGLALGSRISELKIRMIEKVVMGTAFALITPIGMAIGIGVLNQFNGNDPSTIIAIGTLNALSAGILMWVGLVEMLAHDWVFGELAKAPMRQVVPAGLSLVSGLALMSLLGKWA